MTTQPPAFSSVSYVNNVPFTSDLKSTTTKNKGSYTTSTSTPTPSSNDGAAIVKSNSQVGVTGFAIAGLMMVLGGFML